MNEVSGSLSAVPILMAGFALFSSSIVFAQKAEVTTYIAKKNAVISITNNYGPITVKPSTGRQVEVRAIAHSNVVKFENEQHGKRIALRSISDQPGTALCEYAVLVPIDSFLVALGGGAVHVEGLSGDILLESGNASIEISNIDNAYVHVRTMDGPIALSGIRNSHVDIHSINGNISIAAVRQSWVDVNSVGGRIEYIGDPGSNGEYLLTTHSGDLEVSVPAAAPVEIKAHSLNGETDPGGQANISGFVHKNFFAKPALIGTSRFVLRSFRGKIHVARP